MRKVPPNPTRPRLLPEHEEEAAAIDDRCAAVYEGMEDVSSRLDALVCSLAGANVGSIPQEEIADGDTAVIRLREAASASRARG